MSPTQLIVIITASCYLLVFHDDAFTLVHALAAHARSRKQKGNSKRNNKKSPRAGGFANVRPVKSAQNDDEYAASDALAKRAVSNLFSVCSHIQNPRLYQPKWADACAQSANSAGKPSVIATKNVDRGHVLTLFPIHALGLRTLHKNLDLKKSKKNGQSDTEFVAYDQDEDGEIFAQDEQKAGLRMKLNIPLDAEQPAASVIGNRKRHVLFSMFLPEKAIIPGWLGGRMKSAVESNCVTIPLPGAAPLCAIIATKDVKEGDEIIQAMKPLEPNVMGELKSILAKEYGRDISSLGMHIEMACQTALDQLGSVSETKEEELGPFHRINLQYPGITQIHRNPDIYTVENFLTDDECERIIAKARPHLKPCLVNNEKNGKVEQDPARTSMNANLPQAEVPAITHKMTELACCNANQLEILQVLHYAKGQQFIPHTDGFAGPFTACGFEQSTRLATIFCYLNDVNEGGSTYFPELDLNIQPRKGTAVIHFPADVNMMEDGRTLHQGMPAVDDKWLLTTWVWARARSDEMYAESKLPALSSDVI